MSDPFTCGRFATDGSQNPAASTGVGSRGFNPFDWRGHQVKAHWRGISHVGTVVSGSVLPPPAVSVSSAVNGAGIGDAVYGTSDCGFLGWMRN
jgi:hypothetical protein